MLGALVGDIVGSRFEFSNTKSRSFDLFASGCRVTDDSVMSLAVARAILDCADGRASLGEHAVKRMRELGRRYPRSGFGGRFLVWLMDDAMGPYESYGNGAAMRVSACGLAAASLDEARSMARAVTEVTHNHPEGLRGAEATACCVFLARQGTPLAQIRDFVRREFYSLDFTLDEIRPSYRYDVSCQGSVPQAIESFLESTSFEDAIRNAISLGGDSDTIGAITGGMAEGFYGVPENIRTTALGYLDEHLAAIVRDFEAVYPPRQPV